MHPPPLSFGKGWGGFHAELRRGGSVTPVAAWVQGLLQTHSRTCMLQGCTLSLSLSFSCSPSGLATTCRWGYPALTATGTPPRPSPTTVPCYPPRHPTPRCLRDAAPLSLAFRQCPRPCPALGAPPVSCPPHLHWRDHPSSPRSSAGELLFTPQDPAPHLLLMPPPGREGSCGCAPRASVSAAWASQACADTCLSSPSYPVLL